MYIYKSLIYLEFILVHVLRTYLLKPLFLIDLNIVCFGPTVINFISIPFFPHNFFCQNPLFFLEFKKMLSYLVMQVLPHYN